MSMKLDRIIETKRKELAKSNRLIKRLKKIGSKTAQLVNVKHIHFDGAKPNMCNSNAINLIRSNKKKYDFKFGYLLYENQAVAHMWNYDNERHRHVDCTPLKHVSGLSYINASDLLFPIYCKTWDMTGMPAYFVNKTSIQKVNYNQAHQMSGLAKAS